MAVTLEILNAEKIFLMRSGRNHKVYGDPYTFSAVWLVNGPHAEIIGGYGHLFDIREMKAAARQHGVEFATWERCLSGILIPHTLHISKD